MGAPRCAPYANGGKCGMRSATLPEALGVLSPRPPAQETRDKRRDKRQETRRGQEAKRTRGQRLGTETSERAYYTHASTPVSGNLSFTSRLKAARPRRQNSHSSAA